MGRKGVSKRKKAKEKTGLVSGNTSAGSERKAEKQPEQVIEKGKAAAKGNQKP